MYKYFTIIFVLFIIIFSVILPNVKSSNYDSQEFQDKIKKIKDDRKIIVNGEKTLLAPEVFEFYEAESHSLVWSNAGKPLPYAYELITVLEKVNYEGLDPEDYHLSSIKTVVNKLKKSNQESRGQLVKFDLLLTDAFLKYGSHLLTGKNNPYNYNMEVSKTERVSIIEILQNAVNTGQIKESLRRLTPDQFNYFEMRNTVMEYQRIVEKGGWSKVSHGSKLERGDHGKRVISLKKRLRASGDFKESQGIKDYVFDRSLEMAVYRFQYRQGLKVDGVVGEETLEALNVSAEKRLKQLKLNMKRLRWLPRNLGQEYILVNIADFRLKVVNEGQVVRVMKVIVGMATRQTPSFKDQITYLVINPYWNIPRQIAIRDILPIIRRNPEYLTRKNINVFRNWKNGANKINPREINWPQVRAENFDYKLRQEPGPNNPLGRIKFMFPNKYNVYLHDTPEKKLFNKSYRAFSSGCIRVEEPIELAQYLLKNNSNWDRKKIMAAIRKGEEKVVKLSKRVPIYLVYLTAWVSGDGTVQFRNDIYNRDF